VNEQHSNTVVLVGVHVVFVTLYWLAGPDIAFYAETALMGFCIGCFANSSDEERASNG
jgi:hypothetical protein